MQYGLAQAKAQLSYLTQMVDAGQEVLIARHGQPLYRLVSIQNSSASAPSEAASPPNGLAHWRAKLALAREKTKVDPQDPGSFVAQWRQNERF